MFPNELVGMYQDREKTIHDTWVVGCGLKIKVNRVKVVDGDGDTIAHDNDPTGIPIGYVSYDELDTKEYEQEEDTRYMIVVNNEFSDATISFENLLRESEGDDDVSTMNEIYAYINGGVVPPRSHIVLEEYPLIKYEVEEVMKKRPISNIRRYRMVRQ